MTDEEAGKFMIWKREVKRFWRNRTKTELDMSNADYFKNMFKDKIRPRAAVSEIIQDRLIAN